MAFIPPPHAASRPDRKQIVIAADTTNYNLANDLTNNYGWDGTSPIDAQVTINPGVSVSATATTAPAFHADLVSGSTLTLDNHGVIVGKGGSAGSAGGHAISLQDVAATINNIPARNLMSKSEALDHGDWSGHTGVTANANSKNIIPWSQKIQSWSNGGTTVVADAMIAPDGTKTMDTIEVNAGSTYQWANRGMWFNVALSTLHTISVYMKHSGSNRTLINFMNPASPYTSLGRLYHDWSGGTPTQHAFSGDGATGTPVLEDVGNDIWRISFQVMSSATATAAGLGIYPYAGFTGNDPIGVWGVQVQEGGLSAYEETGGYSNPPIATPINGSATADLWQRSATSGQYTYQYLTKPTIPQTYTVSCYARRSVGDYFSIRLQGSYPSRADAVFDLNTGTIKTSQLGAHSNFSNASATIDSVGGGWYHCTFTATTDSHTYLYAYVSVNSRGVPIDYTDVITNSSAYFWGFQLELTNGNLYKNPEDLSGSGWAYSATITTDAATNPVDGAMTADKAQITDGSNTSTGKREQSVPLIAGQTYIHSVYMKNIDASTTRFTCWNNNGGAWLGYLSIAWAGGLPGAAPTLTAHYGASNEIAEDVGNGWYRISCRLTAAAGSGLHASGTLCSINSTGTGIYVYGFQMELLTADGKPSPYIPVSRNLVPYPESSVKTFNIGTSTGSAITDNYVIAPDGTKTAALIEDTSTSLGAMVQANITIPDDSSKYTWSFYVKKDQNTARFPVFWLNFFGSSLEYNYMNFDTKTGAIHNFTPTRLTARSVSAGDYWRISMTIQNNSSGRTGIALRSDPVKISNLSDSVWSLADNTMTGSIVWWGHQLEVGTKNLVTHPEELDNAAWIKPAGSGVAPVVTANANSVNINPYSENAKLNFTTVNTTTITENVAIAPDGLLTADRIADTSTTSVQYNQKNIAIAANTDKWTWSFYILKDSNTTRFPRFYMGLYYGSNGNQNMVCWLNTSTGAVQNGTGDYALTSVVSEDAGDYWRVSLTGTNNGGNTILYTQVWPCASSSMGGGLHNHLTGSVVFAHSQVEVGATASQYEPKLTGGNYVKMLAPDGTETAEYLSTTDTANRRVYQSPGKPTFAEEYTFSIHVKKSIGDYFALRLQGAWPNRAEAVFNLETGVASTPHYGGATPATGATIKSLPNGWFRVSVTFVSDDASTVSGVFAPAITSNTVGGTDSAAGAAAYVWGAQIERGPLTDYEEASGYIAIGNKSTRYQPFDDGVVATLGGLGTSSSTPRILGGGGGGGSGGASQGHGSSEDQENPCSGGTPYTAGGAGGNGAGPGTQTAGNSGSNASGTGGSGGGYGAAGSSGSQGSATGCNAHNHGVGSGGAAGKAIHLVSGATLTLRSNGDVIGATA